MTEDFLDISIKPFMMLCGPHMHLLLPREQRGKGCDDDCSAQKMCIGSMLTTVPISINYLMYSGLSMARIPLLFLVSTM